MRVDWHKASSLQPINYWPLKFILIHTAVWVIVFLDKVSVFDKNLTFSASQQKTMKKKHILRGYGIQFCVEASKDTVHYKFFAKAIGFIYYIIIINLSIKLYSVFMTVICTQAHKNICFLLYHNMNCILGYTTYKIQIRYTIIHTHLYANFHVRNRYSSLMKKQKNVFPLPTLNALWTSF